MRNKTGKFVSGSVEETRAFAMSVAQNIIHVSSKRAYAYVIALDGMLGSGKTTFVQGFAKGLGVRGRITSPTFAVVKKFPISSPDFQYFYHIDMYRIPDSEDVKGLGLREVFSNNANLVIVEWPYRISRLLPRGIVWVKMSHGESEDERVISVGE